PELVAAALGLVAQEEDSDGLRRVRWRELGRGVRDPARLAAPEPDLDVAAPGRLRVDRAELREVAADDLRRCDTEQLLTGRVRVADAPRPVDCDHGVGRSGEDRSEELVATQLRVGGSNRFGGCAALQRFLGRVRGSRIAPIPTGIREGWNENETRRCLVA